MSAGRNPQPREEFAALLTREAAEFGWAASDLQLVRLAGFLRELDLWRRRINLTGRLAARDLARHALESLVALDAIPRGARVVDVGTGGGFPGAPIGIQRPDLEITWLEPREKRAAFLRHVARSVPVENAEVRAGRVEELAAGTFDAATARALRLEPWLKDARFLVDGGSFLLWTTRTAEVDLPGLTREEERPIPGSRERVVAILRRSNVPRETS